MPTLHPKYAREEREDIEEEFDDRYDEYGRPTPNGLYDAGGHVIAGGLFDYVDLLQDEFKYRD